MVTTKEKQTFRDDRGRKVRTEHYTKSGILDYTNEYFYNGNDKVPSRGLQTYVYENGTVGRIRRAVYSAEQNRMVFINDCLYDENGDKTQEHSFDEKTGCLTKEKIFKKNSEGYIFAHRKTFDKNGNIESDGIYIVLAGKLWPIEDKKYNVLGKIENPFKKESKIRLLNRFVENIR